MHISARRLLVAAVSTLAAAALVAPVAAHAAPPSPTAPAGHIGGLVPVHGAANGGKPSGGGGTSSGSNMSYHNGPVMHANTVYAIYWDPVGAMSPNYQPLINGFFTNVAAAGATQSKSNVYAINTQYYDYTKVKIGYSWTFGGYLVDRNPLPASGCSDSVTPNNCLSDAQIQSEIVADLSSSGWSNGAPAVSGTSMVMMFTPPGEGSCSGSSCAFTQYCAYHGYFSSATGTVYYSNMPYTGTDLSACGSGQYPNSDPAADSEINVLSHEQNETITDENLNAWYDRRGYEIGDKCAWNFGTTLGSTAYGKYNQLIGSGQYYLQQEWSNQNSACALTLH